MTKVQKYSTARDVFGFMLNIFAVLANTVLITILPAFPVIQIGSTTLSTIWETVNDAISTGKSLAYKLTQGALITLALAFLIIGVSMPPLYLSMSCAAIGVQILQLLTQCTQNVRHWFKSTVSNLRSWFKSTASKVATDQPKIKAPPSETSEAVTFMLMTSTIFGSALCLMSTTIMFGVALLITSALIAIIYRLNVMLRRQDMQRLEEANNEPVRSSHDHKSLAEKLDRPSPNLSEAANTDDLQNAGITKHHRNGSGSPTFFTLSSGEDDYDADDGVALLEDDFDSSEGSAVAFLVH